MKLPEEDELGFGTRIASKEKLNGVNRLFDGDRNAAKEFLRRQKLDFGKRVHCYVEGETEYGAVLWFFGEYSHVEIINLEGKVAQGRKGFAFLDSLRADRKANIFSLVLIDREKNDDVLRALRKVAEANEMFGIFYISNPDFEFENFTLSELEEILWKIAVENGANEESRQKLHTAIANTDSGTSLLNAARRTLPELLQAGKGKEWGERLMNYAWENPEMVDETTGTTKRRLIVNAVTWVLHTADCDYHASRARFRIDPDTGKPVERDTELH